MNGPSWIDAVRAVPVLDVAAALGRTVRGRAFGPCPACGEARRGHEDKRPPCGLTGDGKAWRCHACESHGDALYLVARLVLPRPPAKGDAEGWATVRAECAARGWCDEGGIPPKGPGHRTGPGSLAGRAPARTTPVENARGGPAGPAENRTGSGLEAFSTHPGEAERVADAMQNAPPVAPMPGILDATTWPSTRAPGKGKPWRLTWEALAERLADPSHTLSPDLDADGLKAAKLALPLWCPGTFRNHYRDGAHVERRGAVVLDLDAKPSKPPPERGTPDLDALTLRRTLTAALPGIAWLAHTTPGARRDAWRWRVVLPLSRPVGVVPLRDDLDGGEWGEVCGYVRARLLASGFEAAEADPSWCEAERGYYVPARANVYERSSGEGGALDVDALLAVAPSAGWKRWAEHTRDLQWPEGGTMAEDKATTATTGEAEATKGDAAVAGLTDRWRTVAEWGADWLDTLPPARAWLLRDGRVKDREQAGALPLGRVGIVAGSGGAGKTWALVQLAVAVASGVEAGADMTWPPSADAPRWLGTFAVSRPGCVALLCGEEEADELRRRLYNAVKLAGLDNAAKARVAARIVAVPLPGLNPALLTGGRSLGGKGAEPWARSPFADELRRRLDAGGPWSLVILDPLVRFGGADAEVDSAAATRLIELGEDLTTVPGTPAVLFGHHITKAAQRAESDPKLATSGAARGSSGLTDASRWVARLMRGEGDFATLRVTKASYGKRPEAVDLVSDMGPFRKAEDADRKAAAEAARKAQHERDVAAGQRKAEKRAAEAKGEAQAKAGKAGPLDDDDDDESESLV